MNEGANFSGGYLILAILGMVPYENFKALRFILGSFTLLL